MLERFEVIHAAGDFEGRGTLVHCFDGRQLVLTAIPREALEDYFQVESLTTDERALIVESNIEAFRRIIAAKYEAREYSNFVKHGQTFPLVTIRLNDMEGSGASFSDSVVATARTAHFVKT